MHIVVAINMLSILCRFDIYVLKTLNRDTTAYAMIAVHNLKVNIFVKIIGEGDNQYFLTKIIGKFAPQYLAPLLIQ